MIVVPRPSRNGSCHSISRTKWCTVLSFRACYFLSFPDHLPLTNDPNIKVFSNGTLIIMAVSKSRDEGRYSCEAKNRQGVRAEGTTNIKVIGTKHTHLSIRQSPSFNVSDHLRGTVSFPFRSFSFSVRFPVSPQIHPFSIPSGLQSGDRLSLTCSAFKGSRPITFSWLNKDNSSSSSRPPQSKPIQIDEFTSILTFSTLSPSDAGTYTCLAENPAGSASHSAVLEINGNLSISPSLSLFSPTRACTLSLFVLLPSRSEGGDSNPASLWTCPGRSPSQISMA